MLHVSGGGWTRDSTVILSRELQGQTAEEWPGTAGAMELRGHGACPAEKPAIWISCKFSKSGHTGRVLPVQPVGKGWRGGLASTLAHLQSLGWDGWANATFSSLLPFSSSSSSLFLPLPASSSSSPPSHFYPSSSQPPSDFYFGSTHKHKHAQGP